MAKITLANGAVVEGTVEELMRMSNVLGVPTFQIGDHVKPTSAGNYGGVDVGTVGKITKGPDEDGEYRVDLLDDSDHDYFKLEQLVKVTDEEVAEATRKLDEKAKIEKWAKIGRKTNEFKEGDIVRITHFQCGANKGSIVEVRSIFSERHSLSYVGGYTADFHAIELITPVEARFDR